MLKNRMLFVAMTVLTFPILGRADGDGLCSEESMFINHGQCLTAGAATAGAAVSGIYAVRKYSMANALESKETVEVFNQKSAAVPPTAAEVNKTVQTFKDGDKVTVHYNLSVAANREHHINLMEEEAKDAKSSASSNRITASLALMPQYRTQTITTTDSNGQMHTTTQQVYEGPNYSKAQYYESLAQSDDNKAAAALEKAAEARAGGPVPTYVLDKVFSDKNNGVQLTKAFVDDQVSKGSRILTMDRLPYDKLLAVRGLMHKSIAGAAGVALGVGLAGEELISGQVAKKLSNPAHDTYVPQMNQNGVE